MKPMLTWPLRSTTNSDFMPAIRKLIKQKYSNQVDCQIALKHLENLEKGEGDIEAAFAVLKLGSQSRSSRIVTIALDCIQKLVAYGHLLGNRPDPERAKGLLSDSIVETVCNCFHGPATDDNVQLQIIKALLTLVTSPMSQVHDASLLLAVQTTFDIYLSSRNSINQITAKATLTQMLNCTFQKMEQYREQDLDDYIVAQCLSRVIEQVDQNLPSYVKDNDFEPSNILHYDAYIIFHSLCKFSMKPTTDEHQLKSKVLSLQLISSILQDAGPVMKSGDIFLSAIKQYLCVALSKNGLSNSNEILSLTLTIFLSLLKDFKVHLKLQIEVFFKEIILSILESSSSSFEKRCIVLDALTSMCSDAQCMVDIFVNYDCDLQSVNLFERIVTTLSRIAQGKGSQSSSSDAALKIKEKNLSIRSFECLVAILKCMVDWSKDLYINPFLATKKNLPNNNEQHNQEDDSRLLDTSSKARSISANANNIVGGKHTSQSACCTNNNNNGETSSTTGSIASNSSSHHQQPQQTQQTQHLLLLANATISDDPEQIEVTKMHKGIIEHGIELFSRKPVRGLEFLRTNGYLNDTEDDIAAFLFMNSDKIDKTTLGEFIGDLNNKEIMYKFVDQMTFADRDFVSALRQFLGHFRLPGEAQKIDRLMEKFAARYCDTNPNNQLFHSADVAYVLSYSIIILTTDLHSPQVKNKMTKEQYIRMNQPADVKDRGLPVEFLSQIYDEIASSEIKVKGQLPAVTSQSATSNKWTDKLAPASRQKRLLYNMEMESMAETARKLMESVSHVDAQFTLASHLEHVKPMFKTAWTPFLVAFSVGLQDFNDSNITCLCLLGFRYAIRISGTFRMTFERDAFVQALARFTLLTTNLQRVVNIREKNIEALKTLIMVAHSEGNYLGSSWLDVMRCISQLEYAQLIGANDQQVAADPTQDKSSVVNNMPSLQAKFERLTITVLDSSSASLSSFGSSLPVTSSTSLSSSSGISSSLSAPLPSPSSISSTSTTQHPTPTIPLAPVSSPTMVSRKVVKLLSDNMYEISSQSIFLAVDRIFNGSVLLDGDAIVEFVRALCQISNEELAHPQSPRMFSLTKLVEISYYNMNRIRLQWSRIWAILGDHFNKVGCSLSEEVCIFAIDSLRQLSMKFIEKGEFSNFRFQKDFLRPFEHIMKNNNSMSIRDMVVRCICQMVSTQANNIRSGWKNIFTIIRIAAWDEEETIVTLAFNATSDIVFNHYKTNPTIMIDSFQDAVECLSEFACNQNFPSISMDAIRSIRYCASYVSSMPAAFQSAAHHHSTSSSSSSYNLTDSFPHLATNNNIDLESLSATPKQQRTETTQQPPSATNPLETNLSKDDLIWIRGWFPVLFELSRIINTCKLDVRTRALTILHEIIKAYGKSFTFNWWQDSVRIVFRILDNMKCGEQNACSQEVQSLACSAKILFELTNDSRLARSVSVLSSETSPTTTTSQVQTKHQQQHSQTNSYKLREQVNFRIKALCAEAFDTYISIMISEISVSVHVQSWHLAIVSILNALHQVNSDDDFVMFLRVIYQSLCNLLQYDLKPEVRSSIKYIFIRFGGLYLHRKVPSPVSSVVHDVSPIKERKPLTVSTTRTTSPEADNNKDVSNMDRHKTSAAQVA